MASKTIKRGKEAVKFSRRKSKQATRLTESGKEILDSVPVAPTLGNKRQPSITEQIRAMVRSEALRQAAENEGFETFEEADDFNVGDDYDPTSPYEEVFEGIPAPELPPQPAEPPGNPPVEGGGSPPPEPSPGSTT